MPDVEAPYVFSPGLDQAKAIGQVLRHAHPARRLTGVSMPGEARPLFPRPFDEIVALPEAISDEGMQLVPSGARSTAFLLEQGDIHLGSVTMSRAALQFYDKNWSLDAAEKAGIPMPMTWTEPEKIAAFPVFYKSNTEGGGRRGIARAPEELPQDAADLIFQEYIESPGTYGVCIIATDGELRAAHIHHEVESYPRIGGSAVIIERIGDVRLRRHAERLIRHTRFSGWGLIEFKYCPRRDDYVFMELNAKFWASSEFAFRNEPLFTRLLFGVEPVGAPCQRMIFMHRAFSRGWIFLGKTLPAYAQGAELRFAPGMWQIPLAHLLIPRPVVNLLRGLRS